MNEDKPFGLLGSESGSIQNDKPDSEDEVGTVPQTHANEFNKDSMVASEPEVTVFEERPSYSMSDVGKGDDNVESYQEKRKKYESEIFRLIDQSRYTKRQILYYLCEIYKHRDAFFVGKDKGYRTNFPKYVKDTFGQRSSTIYGDVKLVTFLVKKEMIDLLNSDQKDLVTVLKRIAHAPLDHQDDLLEDISIHDRVSIANRIREIRDYGKVKIPEQEKFVLPDDFEEHWSMAKMDVEGDKVIISLSDIPKEFRQYYAKAFDLFGIENKGVMARAFFQACKLNYQEYFKLLDSISEEDSDNGPEADLEE